MRYRLTSWSFAIGLIVGSLSIISYNFVSNNGQSICGTSDSCTSNIRPIKCWIEGRRKLNCLKDESEVYLPFNKFIKKQFEVYGRVVDSNASNVHFEYYTSYSKSKRPDIRNYTSFGVFGNFGSFNVEKRERVKCMNGVTGLPMSNQWDDTPYYYPVQIAQFGLQHYSKLLTDPTPKIKLIGSESITAQSTGHPIDDSIILNESDFAIIKLSPDLNLSIVKFEWKPLSSTSSFIFIVEDTKTGQTFTLNYVFSDRKDCLWSTHDLDNNSKQPSLDFFYSLGVYSSKTDYSTIIRDLNVDTLKALSLSQAQGKKDPLNAANVPIEQYKPLSLTFHENAHIKLPINQQSSAHRELFLITSEWLLQNQGLNGGWQVPVAREVSGIKEILKPGWISAMGQGHVICVLVRAFNLTNDQRYIHAAESGLRPFEMEAVDGGVRNHYLGLPWYEEYPTQPPSLVLNGFLYSMIGLYDMSKVSIEPATKAKQLFEAGLESLRVLLPFYDTGRGSTYDLKHATARIIPNLARPDYHKAHVYLLKWMYLITGDKLFDQFSNRWFEYSIGGHAKNNG